MLNHLQQKYTQVSPIAILGIAVEAYNALLLKLDNFKVDLQSSEGIEAFKSYMQQIEELIDFYHIPIQKRTFRDNYTQAYIILYNENQLGYIPQIFDAAQEGFPYIWVNGECFLFEGSTIEKGEKLVQVYFRLIQLIRLIYLHSYDKNKDIPAAYSIQLKQRLQQFDASWISYQKAYIEELIKIQLQAKKNIVETVLLEKQLTNYESEQKLKGKIFYQNNSQFHNLRRMLCEKIGKLNSVANISGKGRDDLLYEILLAAENVLTKVSDSQSKSIRIVAQKIRESFTKLRQVLKHFEKNLEMVDPQLKNNERLVEALADYESSWQKGKRYFLQQKKQNQILTFSTILQAAKEKYPNFKDQLEYSDPCVFWMIPSIMVLNSLQGEDEGLAESFMNEMKSNQKLNEQYEWLKQQYWKWKQEKRINHKKRQLYNQLQRSLILENGQGVFQQIASKIKQFSINLERLNPTDWNDMLSVLLTEEV